MSSFSNRRFGFKVLFLLAMAISLFSMANEKTKAYEDPITNIAGLKAEDFPNDQGGVVKISWQRLTDIVVPNENKNYVGYEVLREEQPVVWGGYEIICVLPSLDTTSCLDKTAETGKEYHYWVVGYYLYNSYTTNEELRQGSRVVEDKYVVGRSIDNLAPAKPSNVKLEFIKEELKIAWQKNTEPDMGTYAVNFYSNNNPNEKAAKSFTAYGPEFTIKWDNYYKNYKFISIQAKDKNNNLSAEAELVAIPINNSAAKEDFKSSAQQQPPVPPQSKFPSTFEDYVAIGGFLLIFIILILYVIYRRQEKQNSIKNTVDDKNH